MFMKHYLRFMITLILATVWSLGGYAQETKSITCTLAKNASSSTFNGGSFSLSYSRNVDGSNNDGVYWNCGKGEVSVTAKLNEANANITKIVANAKCRKTTPRLSVNVGNTQYGDAVSLTTSSNDYTFTGDATGDVVLNFTGKASSKPGSYFLKTITIYYTTQSSSDKTATKLTFPQSSISFATTDDLTSFTGQTPTLTAGDETLTGKSFTYSKSGDDIFSSFNEETGVLALNGNEGTATVTATFAGDDTYASTSGSYTVKVNKVYSDLASFKNAIPSSASTSAPVSFSLKLTDAIVTYVNGTDAYVQDATTGVFLYDSSKKNGGNAFDLTAGQKFTGEIDVTACMFNGMAQVMAWTPAADVVKEENVEIPVKTVTLSELNGSDYSKYECVRVKVENATVTTAYSTAKKATITQGDQTYLIHGEVSGLDVNQDDICDFVGYPIYWKTKALDEHQLSIWSQDDITVKSSVVATTISFNSDFDATKTYTFRNGVATSDYTKPTVTVNPTEATGKVTYKSSDTDVVEVGEDGTLNFTGKTKYDTEATITAQFIGTGNYTNSEEISYKVKNVEAMASLAFSESTVTVMQGKESEFVAPTLTLLDANGSPVSLGDNDIYYESSTTAVADVNVASGKVTFVAPGTTTVTANYLGNNSDYEGLTASYTLVYKEKELIATTVEFTSTDNSVNIGEGITVKAVVKANGVEVEGATVTYSASNGNVNIDENTGYIKGVTEGTSTITATFAGNADYAGSSEELNVTVTDPNKKIVTFDFSKPEDYGYATPATDKKTELKDGDKISSDGVVLTNVIKGSLTTRFTNDDNVITFRMYPGANLTLSAPDGFVINKVVFDDTKKCEGLVCTPGTLDVTSQTWSGLANIITFTVKSNKYVFLNSMTVTCIRKQKITLTEGNNKNDIDNAVKITDNLFDVTLNRTMRADGGWYTFCVPFDIDDISTTPLKDAEIRKYQSMTGSVMNFEATTSLKAAHAYLVKPTTDIENPVFNDVTVSLGDEGVDGNGGYEFVGILSATNLKTDGTNLFLGAENKFYIPTKDDYTLKALRGYFVAPSSESGAQMAIRIDDTTTSIAAINGNAATMNGKVYNLSGQYVGNDVKALPKGIYIVNGKKYIVK